MAGAAAAPAPLLDVTLGQPLVLVHTWEAAGFVAPDSRVVDTEPIGCEGQWRSEMPRVLFPNVPMRMVLQPRNKMVQNIRGAGARAREHDPRREGAWSKVVVHAPPSTNKFEIKQYLSKIYNLDVKKVRPA